MKFTIKREKWRCGIDGIHKNGKGKTKLINQKEYKCCLGFIAEQCGIEHEKIRNISDPIDIKDEKDLKKISNILVQKEYTIHTKTKLASKAMYINDNTDTI